MKYALIEAGKVANIIEWDGDLDAWQPAEGVQAVAAAEGVFIGQDYVDGQFVPLPDPETPPVGVPQSVSRAQAKLALLAEGLLDDVEQAIAGMTGDEFRRAMIEWNERATFERQSPFLLQMAAALGLDDVALDALFVDAASR